MRLTKKTVVAGLGLAAACSICLVPMVVPAAVLASGVGLASAGYWALGAIAATIATAVWWQRHRKRCACCQS